MKKLIAVSLFSAVIFAGCSAKQTTTPATENTTSSEAPTEMSPMPTSSPETMMKSDDKKTEAQIDIQNFAFSPATLTVKAGQTVTVINHDAIKHNVHANDDSFKTNLLAKDEKATFTAPTKPGSYPFVCDPHKATMKGTLVVE
jgi:plastocyanin